MLHGGACTVDHMKAKLQIKEVFPPIRKASRRTLSYYNVRRNMRKTCCEVRLMVRLHPLIRTMKEIPQGVWQDPCDSQHKSPECGTNKQWTHSRCACKIV